MPNKLISMNKVRQVLRCYASGKGTKSISSMLSVSRNTVRKYLHIYQKSGLSIEEIISMDDSTLFSFFQEKKEKEVEQPARYLELEKLLPDYAKRLKKKGVTKELLFQGVQIISSRRLCSQSLLQLYTSVSVTVTSSSPFGT